MMAKRDVFNLEAKGNLEEVAKTLVNLRVAFEFDPTAGKIEIDNIYSETAEAIKQAHPDVKIAKGTERSFLGGSFKFITYGLGQYGENMFKEIFECNRPQKFTVEGRSAERLSDVLRRAGATQVSGAGEKATAMIKPSKIGYIESNGFEVIPVMN